MWVLELSASINKRGTRFTSDQEQISQITWTSDETELLKRHKSRERRRYLVVRLIVISTFYAVFCLYSRLLLRPPFQLFRRITISDFSPEKEVYIRRIFSGTITKRETAIRVWLVIHYFSCNWVIVTSLHYCFAIVSVSIFCLDEPHDWPPLFGSIKDAYTLRGFWGLFWHQLTRRSYTSYARLITTNVFGLRQRSILRRLSINFLVFVFSGLTNVYVSWLLGFRCGLVEEMLWFCGNFFALVLEELVHHIANRWLATATRN